MGQLRFSPLKDRFSTCARSGRSFTASTTTDVLTLLSSPRPIFAFALSESATALRRIGLLLILVRMFINASDSAVESSMILSKRSGLRILENIDSCSGVGVTKTTYSSGIWVINAHGQVNHGQAYTSVVKSFSEYLHHVEVRSCEIWRVARGGGSTSIGIRSRRRLLVPSDFRLVLLPLRNTPVLDYG